MADKDFPTQAQRIEELVHEIEAMTDAGARAKALELVQLLMDVHGAALERMMELIAESEESCATIFDGFARDQLVGHLLLLYGLHPLELETRVVQALDKVRPYLASHHGGVELLGVDEGVVRLRMQGSCHGCPSSAMTLRLAIEAAIYEAAPDVVRLEVEGVADKQPAGLVQLGMTLGSERANVPPNGNGKWKEVAGLRELLAQSAVQALEVGGHSILFCRLEETFYAYGNLCPGCKRPLTSARLDESRLICPACQQPYDLVRAGRGLAQPDLQLEPFPLLVEQGRAKIALPRVMTN